TSGTFIVPIPALRVTALVSSTKHSWLRKRLGRNVRLLGSPMPATPKSIVGAPPTALPGGPTRPPTQPKISNRSNNGESSVDSCRPTDSQVQSRALHLVHFCLPPSFRPTEVGVVDLQFNQLHPEFAADDGKTRLSYYKVPDSKVDRSEGTITSGATSAPFDIKVDHGTHVAALIASHGKLSQMIGVHPNAVIHAIREDDFETAITD